MSHGKAIHVRLIIGITAMNQTAALGPVLSEHPVCVGGEEERVSALLSRNQ